MEEKQNGLGEDQAQEECKPEAEPSRSSQEGGYWGDPYSEVLIGLEQIKALGDVLVSVITSNMEDFKQAVSPDVSPFDLADDTLPTLGHLIQEKAARTKELVEELMRE